MVVMAGYRSWQYWIRRSREVIKKSRGRKQIQAMKDLRHSLWMEQAKVAQVAEYMSAAGGRRREAARVRRESRARLGALKAQILERIYALMLKRGVRLMPSATDDAFFD